MADMNPELAWETEWWGNCVNTLHEERKQTEVYAGMMGLHPMVGNISHKPKYDLEGKTIVDIGGGPCSLLLKCVNHTRSVIIDPAPFPDWVTARYECAGITLRRMAGEGADELIVRAHEVWIYNVLQHTDDPARIIANARKIAPVLRIFEWVGFDAYHGHPQELTVPKLREWIGRAVPSDYEAVWVNQDGAVGRAFAGVFVHV